MNIPGYFFDPEKKKYFRITNGDQRYNTSYSNNKVQAGKRQKVIQRTLESEVSKESHLAHQRASEYHDNLLMRFKLGLADTDSEFSCERLESGPLNPCKGLLLQSSDSSKHFFVNEHEIILRDTQLGRNLRKFKSIEGKEIKEVQLAGNAIYVSMKWAHHILLWDMQTNSYEEIFEDLTRLIGSLTDEVEVEAFRVAIEPNVCHIYYGDTIYDFEMPSQKLLKNSKIWYENGYNSDIFLNCYYTCCESHTFIFDYYGVWIIGPNGKKYHTHDFKHVHQVFGEVVAVIGGIRVIQVVVVTTAQVLFFNLNGDRFSFQWSTDILNDNNAAPTTFKFKNHLYIHTLKNRYRVIDLVHRKQRLATIDNMVKGHSGTVHIGEVYGQLSIGCIGAHSFRQLPYF